MAIQRRMSGTLGDMDPGGMALPVPTDPGGMALPAPMDPGGMALPQPPQQQAMPQAPQWQNPAFGPGYAAGAPRLEGNILYEHGNQRILQPHEVAGMQQYVDQHHQQYGWNNGNTWGSGDAAVDPFMGQLPFPAGRGPQFGDMPPGQGGGLGPPQMPNWGSGPYMPRSIPDPAFDAFYQEQIAAGKSFPEAMDAWGARNGGAFGDRSNPMPGNRYDPNAGPWNHAMGSASGNALSRFSSGPHQSGNVMGGAMQGAMGPWGPAIGAGAGALTGFFGGRRGGGAGAVANRWRGGGTLGNLAPTGSSYGVEPSDPTLLR